MREELAASIGHEAADAVRMPGVLLNVQDVWVVARGPRAVKSLSYDAGPFGAIEVIHVDGATITVEGWAVDKGFVVPGGDAARDHRHRDPARRRTGGRGPDGPAASRSRAGVRPAR